MKRVYDRTMKRAKEAFDPPKARSREARDMAEEAAQASAEKAPASGPRASVDDLAEPLAKLEELHERGAIGDRDYERREASDPGRGAIRIPGITQ